MAIEKDKHGEFYAECSSCEDIEELPDAGDFQEAVEEVKALGWKITHIGGEWYHLCPTCKGAIG